MISEIIDLLELTRNLVQRKNELNKSYFEDFIEPMWVLFNKIHNDYKTSFKEYSQLLMDSNIEIDSLVQKIRQDSIYTMDLREQLYAIHITVKNDNHYYYLQSFLFALIFYFSLKDKVSIQESKQKKDNERFVYKIVGIGDPSVELMQKKYFLDSLKSRSKTRLDKFNIEINEFTNHDINYLHPYENNPRITAIIGLSRGANYDRKIVAEFFEIIIKDVQNRYSIVARAYNDLRKSLLE